MLISNIILRNKKSLLNLCSFFFSGFLSKNLQGELLTFESLPVLQIMIQHFWRRSAFKRKKKYVHPQIAIPIADVRKLTSKSGQGVKNIVGDVLGVHGIVLPFAFLLRTLVGCLTWDLRWSEKMTLCWCMMYRHFLWGGCGILNL